MFFAYFLARQKVGRSSMLLKQKIEFDLKRRYMEPRMKLYVSSSQNQHKTGHSTLPKEPALRSVPLARIFVFQRNPHTDSGGVFHIARVLFIHLTDCIHKLCRGDLWRRASIKNGEFICHSQNQPGQLRHGLSITGQGLA